MTKTPEQIVDCAFCGLVDVPFRDKLSAYEHSLSQLCQNCQDEVFETEEPE
jgi:hypothetical protein